MCGSREKPALGLPHQVPVFTTRGLAPWTLQFWHSLLFVLEGFQERSLDGLYIRLNFVNVILGVVDEVIFLSPRLTSYFLANSLLADLEAWVSALWTV